MKAHDEAGQLRDCIAAPMCNDIISGRDHYEGFDNCLLQIFSRYKKLDSTRWKDRPYQRTLQDKKRFLIVPRDNITFGIQVDKPGLRYHVREGVEDRRSLTLETSCTPLTEGVLNHFNKGGTKLFGKALYTDSDLGESLNYMSIEDPCNLNANQFKEIGISVSGILARHAGDQNWLKAVKNPKYAFDDSELYRPGIRSLFGRRK